MKVKVKICGIRSLETAKAAVESGADFLGFNFVTSSKRFITPATAKKIISEVKGKIKIVGVFQNANISYINKIVDLLDLDFVQLHEKRIIKSVRNKIIYSLVDRKIQGKGEMFNLNKARLLTKKSQIFFAGGLNPDNVNKVIKKVRPYAVDVAGGIETNGVEDIQKIKKFIKNAKGVEI